MLRKRYIIETINNMLKNMAQIVHSRHRSVNDLSLIHILRWSYIKRNEETNTLVIVQKKTKALNAVPIGNTALSWMPPKGDDDFVFHLPAKANVDAALKRLSLIHI